MKIVFLDIDGVLNSGRFLRETQPDRHGVEHLDPAAVARLNRLASAGAFFVLSSAWRTLYRYDRVETMLHLRGFLGVLIDRTPSLAMGFRGDEIANWLATTPRFITSFVILDDGSDMRPFLSRLVQTNYEVGLTDDHVDQALAVLERPWRAREGVAP